MTRVEGGYLDYHEIETTNWLLPARVPDWQSANPRRDTGAAREEPHGAIEGPGPGEGEQGERKPELPQTLYSFHGKGTLFR